MDPDTLTHLSLVVFLVILSAFFSSAETALSAVNRVKLKTLVEQGNKRAKRLDQILDNYSKMISTILIGNNLVNLTAASLTTTLTIRIAGDTFVGVGTGILTLVILTFGEIIPKTIAKSNSEKLALVYSCIIHKLMWIFTPVSSLFELLTKSLSKVAGVDIKGNNETITETELKAYIDVGHEDGILESEEHTLIQNVFNFSETVVKDVMTPRVSIVAINRDLAYSEIEETFKEHMYTRLPVYNKDPDNIIGVLNIKDFLFIEDKENFNIESILRDAHYTYEFKKTSELMQDMRKNGYNLAFVMSEYGACVGMITLEDILEEIVGDIKDEYDEDEDDSITKLADNLYTVDGSMSLADVNNQLNTDFSSSDYDSVAGLIIENLNRMPNKDDLVTLDNGVELKVISMEQNRVTEVSIKIPTN